MNRWCGLAVLLVACVARAESGAVQLGSLLQGIASLQGSFEQQSFDTKGKLTQKLSGDMQVKRPGFFRWETRSPSHQLIVANGNTVWIYDPELEQATRQKMDHQVGNTPALLLSGDTRQLDAAFSISAAKSPQGDDVFTLQPHDREAVFASLVVSFHGRELTTMNLHDNLGQKTEIRFNHIKVNPSIAASQFTFTPPAGTDVIDQSQ